MDDPLEPLRATLAGRYEIVRALGQGAFATVYLARDLRHGRDVALKVLRSAEGVDLAEERFLREIRILARLQHPHILPLHDSGHVDGVLFYVMPYVEGETLRDLLMREPKQTLHAVVAAGREAADALVCAHRHGVVHRDIKPENILLSGGHVILADFGIARALDDSGGRHLTRTGEGSPGTPSYMSPEQMVGEPSDERSDIYSLGCVLYEMLAGEAPFRGAAMKRISERVTPPSTVRADVPLALDRLICRMLARDPSRRVGTAQEVLEWLEDIERGLAAEGSGEEARRIAAARSARAARRGTPSRGKRSDRARQKRSGPAGAPRRAHIVAGVIAGVILLAGARVLMVNLREPEPLSLDQAVFAITPFADLSSVDSTAVLPNMEIMLHEALGRRWKDIRLRGTFNVTDACARRRCPPRTREEALALGRAMQVDVVGMGDGRLLGDSMLVRAALYAVATGALISEYSMRVAASHEIARDRIDQLADSLLLEKGLSPELASGAGTTEVLEAFGHYRQGHEALGRWDLPVAEAEFRAATRSDPRYATAYLWLARVMGLAGTGERRPEEWRATATRAAALRDRLASRDTTHVLAMAALAGDRQPEACRLYRSLIERDSSDFAAWYGLGECNRLDRTVVPDAHSPSGMGFRGSYHEAVDAYERALELVPSAHLVFRGGALERLQTMLFTETTKARRGVVPARDSLQVAAYPAWISDTLAFIPQTFDRLANLADTLNSSPGEAVTRNRRVFRQIALRWLDAFPESPDTHEALARALEATGEIRPRLRGPAAISMARRALELSTDSVQRARVQVLQVRLHLRQGEYREARALVDSLLARRGSSMAEVVPGLALLTGRVAVGEESLRELGPQEDTPLRAGPPVTLDGRSTNLSRTLLLHAAAGSDSATISRLAADVDRDLQRVSLSGTRRDDLRAAILGRPLGLAFPYADLGLLESTDLTLLPILEMQRRFAQGDTAGIIAHITHLRESRRARHGGGGSFDAVYQEAVLLDLLGDSIGAAVHLDTALESEGGRGDQLFFDFPQAACLVRAMALRATLAARTGDRATAARWAGMVVTLWSGADAGLQPVVARMRRLGTEGRS